MASENERLLVSTPSDVWHAPTSYFVTGSLKLSILLHIPVGRVDSYSTVYQYVPTPIALPNSTVHFLIDPMDDFLADNRRTHATSMIPGYRFRQCRRVNEGITYCPVAFFPQLRFFLEPRRNEGRSVRKRAVKKLESRAFSSRRKT